MNGAIVSPTMARRPGFLVRRLHQIFVSIYFQNCEEFQTTPVQSSVMQVLYRMPGMDQVTLAAEIGIDRTTTSNVLGRLERRGIVERKVDPKDRRNKRTSLTQRGEEMIDQMQQAISAAHLRLLEPLEEAERLEFMRMLHKLVEANNDLGRATLDRV